MLIFRLTALDPNDPGHTQIVGTPGVAAAMEAAAEWVLGNWEPTDETYWVDVEIESGVYLPGLLEWMPEGTGRPRINPEGIEWSEEGKISVPVDPLVPPCKKGFEEHEWGWMAPRLNEAGLFDTAEVCSRCGLIRITDTMATRKDTGEQGLDSIRYEISEG
jgi:hypothetical protein